MMQRLTKRDSLLTTAAFPSDGTASIAGLIDEDAAGAMLGVSARTMQRGRATGEGPPYVRVGARRIAYDPVAVRLWAASRTFKSAAAEHAARQPQHSSTE